MTMIIIFLSYFHLTCRLPRFFASIKFSFSRLKKKKLWWKFFSVQKLSKPEGMYKADSWKWELWLQVSLLLCICRRRRQRRYDTLADVSILRHFVKRSELKDGVRLFTICAHTFSPSGPTFNKRDFRRSLIYAHSFSLVPRGFSFTPFWCCVSLCL